MHSRWERYLFWYEMHDDISAVVGLVGFEHLSLSCFDNFEQSATSKIMYSSSTIYSYSYSFAGGVEVGLESRCAKSKT